jgi:hypothetical protein
MRLVTMKVQFATTQPPGEVPNPGPHRAAREFASEWFDLRMRFRFRTPEISALLKLPLHAPVEFALHRPATAAGAANLADD